MNRQEDRATIGVTVLILVFVIILLLFGDQTIPFLVEMILAGKV